MNTDYNNHHMQDNSMLTTPFTMTINGAAVGGVETFGVMNPATARVFTEAPDCTSDELDSAVATARIALQSWSTTPIERRRALIKTFAERITQQAEELAPLLTREQGKNTADALGEFAGGTRYLLEAAKYDLPQIISEDSETQLTVTTLEPIGVVAGIVPWNYPFMLAMCKVAPALLAGNTMILKPAPTTPLTLLRIGEIARDVFPPGVLNVVSGSDRLGPLITAHPGIDKISFTGSTKTGRLIMQSAASTLKSVTLELGGNDASIVLPSVDIEAVTPLLFWAAFINAGQVCVATKRLYVHEDVYERLITSIVEYANTVTVGDGANQDTQIGPLQNQRQFDHVKSLIQDAHDNGYNFLVGGHNLDATGYFVPISILDNPPEDARIVQEEQFGPILPIMKFSTIEEVIDRVNQSDFGLGASIWSNDSEEVDYIAGKLNVGTVWINERPHSSPHASFGGWKQSGIGSEGGQRGLENYTIPKTVFRAKQAQDVK